MHILTPQAEIPAAVFFTIFQKHFFSVENGI